MVGVVVVDMDDTLYDERTFVESGLRAVARVAVDEFDYPDERAAFQLMIEHLDRHGRGAVFDELLSQIGLNSKQNVARLVSAYRGHDPSIALPPASRTFLEGLRADGYPLYVVTDGNARVQARKAEALGLDDFVDHVYCTHRYGRSAAKPATKVFELIAARSGISPADLVYIGDDPTKDFVGVRSLGGSTIRVLTGRLAHIIAQPGFEADHEVASLAASRAIIDSL